MMMYILPGIFYWQAFKRTPYNENKKKYFALALSVIGFVIMAVCVVFILLNATVLDDD